MVSVVVINSTFINSLFLFDKVVSWDWAANAVLVPSVFVFNSVTFPDRFKYRDDSFSNRVPTPPEKSWYFFWNFSRTWKVMKMSLVLLSQWECYLAFMLFCMPCFQWCSPQDHSLGLEAPRGQRIKSWSWDPKSWSWSWSWGKSLGLGLGLDEKVLRIRFFRIYKTGDSHDAGSCPPPAMVTKTSLFASYRKPLPSAEKAAVPLTSIVSSYLAFVQLILNGTEVGTPWRIVTEGQQAVCLFAMVIWECFLLSTLCTSAPVERIFSHWGLFIRPHTARMSDQLLCDLMLAKVQQAVTVTVKCAIWDCVLVLFSTVLFELF